MQQEKQCFSLVEGKLKGLPSADTYFFGVDRHGVERHVNTLENEDDDLHDAEDREDRTYVDEQQRRRSLFSSMPGPLVLRLRERERER